MQIDKVGNAVAYLRKRAGYTQKELADRLGISDKAVSKWERGLGLPDVSLLGKLSLLLDTDTDSLLEGDVIHRGGGWHGLLILENNACGIGAGTIIYDKPLVYYLLSYFLLVGIKTIRILCSKENRDYIQKTVLDGSDFDFSISFGENPGNVSSDPFFDTCENLMLVFGNSFIYGVDMTRFLQRAMMYRDRLTVLALPKGTRDTASALRFDASKKIVSAENGDQLVTQYNYYNIPVLFCPKELFCKSFSDNSNDTDISSLFADQDVYIEALDRGFVEIPLKTWDDISETANLVKTIQKHCGMIIYCLEEVAWRRGMISGEALLKRARMMPDTEYKEYLLSLIGE